ncbi:MAG: hypothetical protein M1331_00140 [Candidatus Marsarchaeota archaeon]|nr:hypothetical protein [Candidatus Marsarchaeota archaeon]
MCKNLETINNGIIEAAAYYNGSIAMASGTDKVKPDKYSNNNNMESDENRAKTLHLLLKQLITGNSFDINLPKIIIDNINSRNFKNDVYNKAGETDIRLKSISISIALAALIKEDFDIKKTARFLLRKTDSVFGDLESLNETQNALKIKKTFDKIERINIDTFKGTACSRENYGAHKNELIQAYHKFIKGMPGKINKHYCK